MLRSIAVAALVFLAAYLFLGQSTSAAVAPVTIGSFPDATGDDSDPTDSGDDEVTIPTSAPGSDPKVLALAEAIAAAEGFGIAGAVPTRSNNPGDLTLSFGFSTSGKANSAGVLIFNSVNDGWSALYKQVALMLYGGSSVYSPQMTFLDVAAKYTGGDNAEQWALLVAGSVGLSITSTLNDYLQS